MPSSAWQTLGTGSILGYLRADLKQTSSIAWVVGPWIDAFFAQFLVNALPATIDLRIVTRPPSGANSSFGEHALAARTCLEARPNTVVKLLNNLHAKVVLIDEKIAYCGSANWYRYSLEESCELVLRGPVSSATGLLDEVQVIWDRATEEPPIESPVKAGVTAAEGYMQEVVDSVAAAKLKAVPGSFVMGQSPRRRR